MSLSIQEREQEDRALLGMATSKVCREIQKIGRNLSQKTGVFFTFKADPKNMDHQLTAKIIDIANYFEEVEKFKALSSWVKANAERFSPEIRPFAKQVEIAVDTLDKPFRDDLFFLKQLDVRKQTNQWNNALIGLL